MNTSGERHIVKRFDDELRELHDLTLDMGNAVRTQIRRAVETLRDRDPEEARNVIADDATVNEYDNKINDLIEQILARRQPMAVDLREILTIGKIVGDLERMGDEGKKIAKLTIHFFEESETAPNYQFLQELSDTAQSVEGMLIESLNAYDTRALKLACEVIRKDIEMDSDFRASLQHLTTFVLEDARTVGHFIDIVLGIRALERIGCHAKNIGG